MVGKVAPGLQLPPSSPYGSGCLSLAGDGQQQANSVPSFVLCTVVVVSYVRAFRVVAIPQSGLLAQVSSLILPLGHSGPVLTLSNAACSSLPSPHLLVADAGICAASPSYRWACNLLVLIIYLFFFPVMLPSVLPRLATDLAARVFPGAWKLLSF